MALSSIDRYAIRHFFCVHFHLNKNVYNKGFHLTLYFYMLPHIDKALLWVEGIKIQ